MSLYVFEKQGLIDNKKTYTKFYYPQGIVTQVEDYLENLYLINFLFKEDELRLRFPCSNSNGIENSKEKRRWKQFSKFNS